MKVKIFFLISLVMSLLGCATHQHNKIAFEPPSASNLTAQVAKFVTTIHSPSQSEQRLSWTLIRSADKIEVLREDSSQSEIWSRTSNDLWYYEKAFHNDLTIVQYSPVDLKSLGIKPQWLNAATAVNIKILALLSPGYQGKELLGFSSTKFKGRVEQTDYAITWLDEPALPAQISQVTNDIKTMTRLISVATLEQSDTTFSDIRSYRLIDYSDLGDMERDPFVRKIQHALPSNHSHDHESIP